MKIRITIKQKMYIVAGIIVIALVSTYFLVYKGQLKKIKELQNQLNVIDSNLSKVQKEREIIPRLLDEIAQAQQKIEALKTRLPNDKQIAELIDELAGLSTKIGIQDYASISFGAHTAGPDYGILPVNINLRCSYPKLMEYLLGLEKLKRMIRIENMELKADPIDPLLLEVKLKVTTFILGTPRKK